MVVVDFSFISLLHMQWEVNFMKFLLALACAASISSLVIAWKLKQEHKKMKGGRGGEKRKRLPADPTRITWIPC